ncbi:MAG: GlsB/YeaQ/YmgE family stress response membrane protein [bacterium]|nr:GlsB/YeaQ/YmgE family stress response membrane protein [bacterium]
MSAETLLSLIIIGAIAGAAAGNIMRGRGYGLLGNILVGIVGAVIGVLLFDLLNIAIPPIVTVSLGEIIVALIGAIIFILLAGLVDGGRRRRRR